jgi:hypothetical protein
MLVIADKNHGTQKKVRQMRDRAINFYTQLSKKKEAVSKVRGGLFLFWGGLGWRFGLKKKMGVMLGSYFRQVVS